VEYQKQTKAMSAVIGFASQRLTLGMDKGSYALFGSAVTANYFQTLGVRLIRGRGFSEQEDRQGSSGLVAVISDRVWLEEFRGDEKVIGRQITLNGLPATVVGVAGAGFHGTQLGSADARSGRTKTVGGAGGWQRDPTEDPEEVL
jgi:hypothetical protein